MAPQTNLSNLRPAIGNSCTLPIRLVIPTRERSEAGEPALSEVEGNLLFHCGMQDSMPNSSREGHDFSRAATFFETMRFSA
jgi:hypothetical protein